MRRLWKWRSRWRWIISGIACSVPGQCSADWITWAAWSGENREPWWQRRIGYACRSDLGRNGACYCGKLRSAVTS